MKLTKEQRDRNRVIPVLRGLIGEELFGRAIRHDTPNVRYLAAQYDPSHGLGRGGDRLEQKKGFIGIGGIFEAIEKMTSEARSKRKIAGKVNPGKAIFEWSHDTKVATGDTPQWVEPCQPHRKRQRVVQLYEAQMRDWRDRIRVHVACAEQGDGPSAKWEGETGYGNSVRITSWVLTLRVEPVAVVRGLYHRPSGINLIQSVAEMKTDDAILGVYGHMLFKEHRGLQDVNVFQVAYTTKKCSVKWGWVAAKKYGNEFSYGIGDDPMEAMKKLGRSVTRNMQKVMA